MKAQGKLDPEDGAPWLVGDTSLKRLRFSLISLWTQGVVSSLPREAPPCGRFLEHGALSVVEMETLGTCTRVSFVQGRWSRVESLSFLERSLNVQHGWGREIFSTLHHGVDASSWVRRRQETNKKSHAGTTWLGSAWPHPLVTASAPSVLQEARAWASFRPWSRMGSMEFRRRTSQPTTAAPLIIRGASSGFRCLCLRRLGGGALF